MFFSFVVVIYVIILIEVNLMMISPETYSEDFQEETMENLIKERDRLLNKLKKYEKGDFDKSIIMNPSPEVIYQCNCDYLIEIINIIKRKVQENEFSFDNFE